MMRATFLIVVLALGGCSAAQCDPSRADFFSGVGCSVGGGYGQRTGALQNTLSTEQSRDIAAREEAGQQEHIAAASEAEAQSLQRRVDEMQRSQAKLRQQLAAAQQRRGAQDSTLQKARRDVDQLDRKIREQQVSPSPDAAAVRQLERDQNQLLQVISRI
jgi:predicted RNase H-like nuclease (RuvC/YqgF family)